MWKRIPKTIGVVDRNTGKFVAKAPVTRVELFPPGSHPPSAIRKDVTLALIHTPYGTRQYGFADGCIDSSLRMRVKLLPGQERDEVVARWPTVKGGCTMLENARKRRKPKTYPSLKIAWSPVNQQWFVLWPGRGPIEQQQVLNRSYKLEDAERYAERISGSKGHALENPRRKLSKKCQGIVSRTAASEQRKGMPQKQAVAIGYSKARKAGCRVPAPRRLENNSTTFWGKFLG